MLPEDCVVLKNILGSLDIQNALRDLLEIETNEPQSLHYAASPSAHVKCTTDSRSHRSSPGSHAIIISDSMSSAPGDRKLHRIEGSGTAYVLK